MKAIMISIKPRYLVKILNGEKTLEIRTKLPKCDLPIDVYIYCTKEDSLGRIKDTPHDRYFVDCVETPQDFEKMDSGYDGKGKVVAKFTLNEIKTVYTIHFPFEYFYKATDLTKEQLEQKSCLSQVELDGYLRKRKGYAWQIDKLEIFDKPKELTAFKVRKNDCPFPCAACDVPYCKLKRPAQSWCYIEI